MRIALVGAMSVFIATTALAGSLADQLIGHWQASHEGFLSDYVIQNDGTFTGYLAQDGKTIWTCAGKWDLNGKTVNTVLTRSSSDKVPVGTKDRQVVVEVTNEFCRLRLQNGSIMKYSKMP